VLEKGFKCALCSFCARQRGSNPRSLNLVHFTERGALPIGRYIKWADDVLNLRRKVVLEPIGDDKNTVVMLHLRHVARARGTGTPRVRVSWCGWLLCTALRDAARHDAWLGWAGLAMGGAGLLLAIAVLCCVVRWLARFSQVQQTAEPPT
jgi:hypothetical protein